MNDLVLFLIILFVGSKIVRRLKIEINPIKAISVTLIITGLVLLLLSYSLYRPMHHANIIGGSIPIIPLLIGIVSIILASFLIIKKQQPNFKSDQIKSNKYYWLLFCIVCLLISLSKYGFLLSIYTPSFYKSNIAIPQLGVGIVLVGSVINATILHFISRFRDNKLSQSFFWISFITVIYCLILTTILCLILIFGLIHHFSISYQFLASILTLGYLPFILSLFLMAFRNDIIKK